MGLKGSVACGVVALQEGRRVADGRSLIYEAMPQGDLVGRTFGRPAEADTSLLGVTTRCARKAGMVQRVQVPSR